MDKRPLTLTTLAGRNAAFDGEVAIACDCELFFGPDGPLHVDGITHMRLEDLTAEVLTGLRPGLIVIPLFSTDHDAASAVEYLEALGFTGRIAVLAPALPRPGLVERELRALGPGARLTLISP